YYVSEITHLSINVRRSHNFLPLEILFNKNVKHLSLEFRVAARQLAGESPGTYLSKRLGFTREANNAAA
uniref:hypothetical protein n=1 Tax=Serratia marcescens TaxID=615 RepID=UPI00237FF93B